MVRIAPAQIQQAGRVDAGPAHGVNQGKIVAQQLITDGLFQGCIELLSQPLHRLSEMLWHQVFGGSVDEIAHQLRRVDLTADTAIVTTWIKRQSRRRPLWRLVAGEAVRAQGPAQAQPFQLPGRKGGFKHVVAFRQSSGQLAQGPKIIGGFNTDHDGL